MNWYLVGRLALAAGLGYVVGWERNVRGHAAGERTFALLALGAAAFMSTVVIDEGSSDAEARVVQGVAAGVGFIGAAVTWRSATDSSSTRGLTTAAAVWAVVAMGTLCGVGELLVATSVAVFTLVLLELRYLPVLRAIDPRRVRNRLQDDDEAA